MDFTNNSNLQDYLRRKEMEEAAKKASRKRIVEEQNKKRWLEYQQHLRNTLGGSGYLGSSIGIVTDGLRLYYDPSILTSYSGSGTTISDLTANGLNGTMSNITYTKPYFNFNGSSSQISIADNALLEPGTGDWTIDVWVNYSVIAGSSRVIVGKTDGGLAADFGYGIRTNSAGATYFEVGNGTTSVTSPSSTLTTGVWYHLVGVFKNISTNAVEFYVDGTFIGSTSHSFTSIKNTTSPLYFGSFNGGEYSQWFNGKMGSAIMYNRALSAAEVLQNYHANKPKY